MTFEGVIEFLATNALFFLGGSICSSSLQTLWLDLESYHIDNSTVAVAEPECKRPKPLC